MTATNYSRKIDASGRLVIPVKLREELNLQDGEVLPFWIHEQDGKRFLCIECPTEESEVERALRVLREHGINPGV